MNTPQNRLKSLDPFARIPSYRIASDLWGNNLIKRLLAHISDTFGEFAQSRFAINRYRRPNPPLAANAHG